MLLIALTSACTTPDELTAPDSTASTAATGQPACRSAGVYDETVMVDGLAFRYRLTLPDAVPRPAVIQFHGGGSTGAAMDTVSGWANLGNGEGVATLTPEGFPVGGVGPQVWNAGACCGPTDALPDHVQATVAMLDHAQAQGACLDDDRVFATGHSNGGMMTYRLACEASDRIAAVAVSAGTLATEDQTVQPPRVAFTCTPPEPVPLLHVHGVEDLCVPLDGSESANGNDLLSIDDAVARFRALAACPAAPSETVTGPVRRQTWSCPDAVEVTLITVDALGHAWAGSDIYGNPERCGGTTTSAVSTTEEAWAFFSRAP